VASLINFGQQWQLATAPRANGVFPAASVFVDDFTVYAFHRHTDGQALKYDVSQDGGQTFPTVRSTAITVGSDDIYGARVTSFAGVPFRVLLLLSGGGGKHLYVSDTVLTLPETSTWTQVALPGTAVGGPAAVEVDGANVLVFGQAGGGGAAKIWHSEDGGTTFAGPVTIGVAEILSDITACYHLCSPSPGLWCLINKGAIYRSADNGASWTGLPVHLIPAGNIACPGASTILAVNATRLIACFKGQIATSDDAGATWTDRQNLTLNPPSPTSINQGAIVAFANFGSRAGSPVLGAATAYVKEFTAAVTRGAFWRSVDFGTTWTLVECVGGVNIAGSSQLMTAFIARGGRGVMDLREAGPTRHTFFNPNPEAVGVPAPRAPSASSFTVRPCFQPC